MERLSTDECCIGKVPYLESFEYEDQFKAWKPAAGGTYTWEIFREGMNSWSWR